MPLKNLLITIFCLFMLILSNELHGQVDSTYIKPFRQDFSVRAYTINKFFAFDKENDKNESEDQTLRTNSPVSLGFGASWKNFSFGFSYGFDFMRDRNRGKTKSMEFQHHGYGRKLAYDIVIQQHKGFHNDEKNKDGSYLIYPDINLNMYGGSLQYIFNHKRFSYKAAFNQNERQIKSTGSLIAGTTLYYSRIRSDSTILFERITKNHENLQIGLTLGYAYTWVINREFFLTGSLTAGASIGNNYPGNFFKRKMEVYPILDGRFAFGYNKDQWSLGFSSHINKIYLFHDGHESFSMENVILKLTFIWRFDWGNKFVNNTLNKAKEKLRM